MGQHMGQLISKCGGNLREIDIKKYNSVPYKTDWVYFVKLDHVRLLCNCGSGYIALFT